MVLPMNESPATDGTEVLDQLKRLLRIVQEFEPGEGGEGLADVVSAHLGVPAHGLPVIAEEVPGHRYVDVDIALERIAGRDPEARLAGIGGGDARYHMDLADMIQPATRGWQRFPLAQVDYVNVATGPDSERAAVGIGVRLFRYAESPVAVLQRRAMPQRGRSAGSLELLCPDRHTAAALLEEVRESALAGSVLRGQIVTFQSSGYEPSADGITFVARPTLTAGEVILPDGVLARVEDHVVGIAQHAAELAARGQHLKRGVLLYGPPGSGKTHTVRYLLSTTPRHTVVLLAGATLQYVGTAAKLARALQPAIVVLEDCDLIAEDRDLGFGAKPLLFEVLDAMDGLDADADVTFLLTTNRVDAMEHALAQRPGRVDLAIEVPLPDEAGRLDLLRLYAPAGVFGEDVLAETAARTEGTTASFAKELIRRAVLAAATAGEELGDDHLVAATDRILDDSERLSRALLGVSDADGSEGVAEFEAGAPAPHRARRGGGWIAHRTH